MNRWIFIVGIILVVWPAHAQSNQGTLRFVNAEGPTALHAEVHWGNLTIVGYDGTDVVLEALHTAEGGMPQPASPLADYVFVEEAANAISLTGRTPQGFESIDLVIRVPAETNIHLRIKRGGEIRVGSMNALVEIDHRNGSVVLEDLGGHALVKAVNGSIAASFRGITPDKAMSFVTLNGEVALSFPDDLEADVWLRTTRNGHVFSAFTLPGVRYPYAQEAAKGTDKEPYGSAPIAIRAPVNGGGPLIVAATENGPIRLEHHP